MAATGISFVTSLVTVTTVYVTDSPLQDTVSVSPFASLTPPVNVEEPRFSSTVTPSSVIKLSNKSFAVTLSTVSIVISFLA